MFNLPVLDVDSNPVESTKPRNLTNVIPLQLRGHKLFECGIRIDSSFRPIDRTGEVFAENLFAAGSVLGGYNYPIEKSGLGVALATGRTSGSLVVQFLREVVK